MCNLPVQKGPRCGAYAAAYYLYFKSNNRNSLNEDFINDIYSQRVKFDGSMEGSDPMKIMNYLNNPINRFAVNVYVSERIDDERLVLLVNSFARNADRNHSLIGMDELKNFIGNDNYAIALWYPANLFEDIDTISEENIKKMMSRLPQMHYMLTKVAGNQLYVVDSNNPNLGNAVNWQPVTNLESVNGNFKFTGLLIK